MWAATLGFLVFSFSESLPIPHNFLYMIYLYIWVITNITIVYYRRAVMVIFLFQLQNKPTDATTSKYKGTKEKAYFGIII